MPQNAGSKNWQKWKEKQIIQKQLQTSVHTSSDAHGSETEDWGKDDSHSSAKSDTWPSTCSRQQQNTRSLKCAWDVLQDSPSTRPSNKPSFKMAGIIQSMFSNYSGIKAEINYRRTSGEFINVWKLNKHSQTANQSKKKFWRKFKNILRPMKTIYNIPKCTGCS